MKRLLTLLSLAALTLILFACSGTSSSSSSGTSGTPQGGVFVTGEDAPLPSVYAFNITFNKVTLNNSSSTVTALSTATTVDFVRLLGVRSMLSFNSVAPGTYTSATFTLSNPVIYYLNTGTTPPSVAQVPNASLTSPTVTVSFPAGAPLVVGANGLVGLHLDFDLRKSLEMSGGQVTGVVNPTMFVTAVQATDTNFGTITDLVGGLVGPPTVNGNAGSFILQGPYGFQLTIDVNSSTSFNPGWTLANMTAPAIVAVEGAVQSDGSILASAVEVISTNQAFISGRILSVSPGPVVTMFVGEELPALGSIPVDSVQTIDLTQVPSNAYAICFIDNPVTAGLFGPSNLVVGQRILIAGSYSGSTFTPAWVSLRLQGVVGDLVANSVNVTVAPNQGSFGLQNNLLLGYLLGGPLTVNTGNLTNFVNINGLSGLSTAGQTNLVVYGLILDQGGTPVMYAGRVRILP